MIYLLLVIAALLGLIVFLMLELKWAHLDKDRGYTAWDIERGRYVAALLAQSRSGDLAASSVVRPRIGPVRSEPVEPKPVMEGM
jgi:hypothetical protein